MTPIIPAPARPRDPHTLIPVHAGYDIVDIADAARALMPVPVMDYASVPIAHRTPGQFREDIATARDRATDHPHSGDPVFSPYLARDILHDYTDSDPALFFLFLGAGLLLTDRATDTDLLAAILPVAAGAHIVHVLRGHEAGLTPGTMAAWCRTHGAASFAAAVDAGLTGPELLTLHATDTVPALDVLQAMAALRRAGLPTSGEQP